MSGSVSRWVRVALAAPAVLLVFAFFVLPLVRLVLVGADGPAGWAGYVAVLSEPRHLRALVSSVLLSLAVTLVSLALAAVCAVFLARHRFTGREGLIALLTLPLAFPGVVVGFMVILLAGRQGVVAGVTGALVGERLVFAYSMAGLFLGYVYFSLPRALLTLLAAAEGLDPRLEEAARALGAPPRRVAVDVLLPGLAPALVAAGAICFATAMGAFGTAFTLATRFDVLPMVIYTEFTLQANFTAAAALSLLLGASTWGVLAWARSTAGAAAAATA